MLITAKMLECIYILFKPALYMIIARVKRSKKKNVKVISLLQGWSFVGTKSKFLGRIWQQGEKERKWEKEGRKEKEEGRREEEERRK